MAQDKLTRANEFTDHRGYPRVGQRLAPSALSEILSVPAPRQLIKMDRGHPVTLCDLDESAWIRFGYDVCVNLAFAVVYQIATHLSKLPKRVLAAPIPAVPPGLQLDDLELDPGTLTLLKKAGLSDNQDKLSNCTIERIVQVFEDQPWCLVDLLTALESATDAHPSEPDRRPSDGFQQEATRERDGLGDTSVEVASSANAPSASGACAAPPATTKGEMVHEGLTRADESTRSCGYPRQGQRLAPATLSEILDVPAPSPLAGTGDRRLVMLRDLDESAWTYFSARACEGLASAVLLHVRRLWPTLPGSIKGKRLPPLPQDVCLEGLGLDIETYNSLCRAGYRNDRKRLGLCTLGDLMSIPDFDARCLVDLLSALESLETQPRSKAAEAADVVAAANLADVKREDRAGEEEKSDLGDFIEVAQEPLSLETLTEKFGDFIEDSTSLSPLDTAAKKMLREQVMEVLASLTPRERKVLELRFGLEDGRGRTLEEVGLEFDLTRERVRQIEAKALSKLRHPARSRKLEGWLR